MPIEIRKLLHAQRDMIALKGQAAHAEAVRIVRELKEAAAQTTAKSLKSSGRI